MAVSCIKYFFFVQSVSAICKERDCRAVSPNEALVIVQNRAVRMKGKARDKRAVENKGKTTMSMESVGKIVGDGVNKGIPHKTQIAIANALGKEEGGFVLKDESVKSFSHTVEQVVSGATDYVHPSNLQAAIARPVDGNIKGRGKVIGDATIGSSFANATLAAKTSLQNGQARSNAKMSYHMHDKSNVASTAALSEDGNQNVAALKDDENLLAFSTADLLKEDGAADVAPSNKFQGDSAEIVTGAIGNRGKLGDAVMSTQFANTKLNRAMSPN